MKSMRFLATFGASIIIVGSFLPWEREGDFVSYWTYGIRLFPKISDYGGVLVLILTLFITLLAFKPPKFIRNPGVWILVISSLLMAVSLIFVTRWLIHHIESADLIGASALGIGLVAVVVGAALVLWSALVNYHLSIQPQAKSTG